MALNNWIHSKQTNERTKNFLDAWILTDFLCAGKKRAWIPDERDAYIEVEIREIDGDKVIVETKDGKVKLFNEI